MTAADRPLRGRRSARLGDEVVVYEEQFPARVLLAHPRDHGQRVLFVRDQSRDR